MQIVYTSTKYKGAVSRAILSIALGVVLVMWPDAVPKYIVMSIGVLFLATGLISFIASNKNRTERPRSFLPYAGIGSIILGLLLLCMAPVFVTVFMYLLGCILVIAAVGQFVTLSAARQFGYVSMVSFLFPVLILIAGIIVLFNPFEANKGVFILFGVTAIFYGITDLINQYNIRKVRHASEEKERIVRMNKNQDVEDAEYEEIK